MPDTNPTSNSKTAPSKPKNLIRDQSTIKDYYSAWDRFDVDEEIKKIDEEKTSTANNIIQETYSKNEGAFKQKKAKILIKGGRRSATYDYEKIKEEGNSFFKERKFKEAIEKYDECIVSVYFIL